MRFSSSLIAWLLLLSAALVWVGVVYFAFSIQSMADAAAKAISDTQSQGQRASIAIREHSIAAGTTGQRSALENTLRNEPLSLATTIAGAGKDAGVVFNMSAAVSEGSVGSTPTLDISAIGFTVEADGTFQSLVRAEQLLENLPLPSSIEELDLSQAPGSENGPWHMNVHVQVFTSFPVS